MDKKVFSPFNYLVNYLQFYFYQLDCFEIKKLFFLIFFDFLAKELDFKNLQTIFKILFFEIKIINILEKQDYFFAGLITELTEIKNQQPYLQKSLTWQDKFLNYYNFNLKNDFHINQKFVKNIIKHTFLKKELSLIKKELFQEIKKNSYTVAEKLILINLCKSQLKKLIIKNEKKQELKDFINQLESLYQLRNLWFLGKNSSQLTEQIKKSIKDLIIKNDIPSYKTGVLVFDNDGEYLTKPVNHIVKKYLDQLKVSEYIFWRQFNLILIKKVFLMAIKDFQDKKISLEDFSTIASKLLFNEPFWTVFDFNKVDHKLSDCLYNASELLYYHWRKDKNKNKKLVNSIILDLNQYYTKETS